MRLRYYSGCLWSKLLLRPWLRTCPRSVGVMEWEPTRIMRRLFRKVEAADSQRVLSSKQLNGSWWSPKWYDLFQKESDGVVLCRQSRQSEWHKHFHASYGPYYDWTVIQWKIRQCIVRLWSAALWNWTLRSLSGVSLCIKLSNLWGAQRMDWRFIGK